MAEHVYPVCPHGRRRPHAVNEPDPGDPSTTIGKVCAPVMPARSQIEAAIDELGMLVEDAPVTWGAVDYPGLTADVCICTALIILTPDGWSHVTPPKGSRRRRPKVGDHEATPVEDP